VNEQTITPATATAQPKERAPIGEPLMKIGDVPAEIRAYAQNKLSPGKDDAGKDIRVNIAVARENGSYYGPVVLNGENYIVQAVGKEHNYAVVHPKENVALQGDLLNSLDANKKLNNFNIQIHYKGDQAKAYPFKPKEKEAATEQAQHGKTSKDKPHGMTPEEVLANAKEYAANIKNAGQRTTFLKHMEAAVAQARHAPAQEAQHQARASAPRSTQAEKQTAQGPER